MKFMKSLRQFLTAKEDVRSYITKAKRKKSNAKGHMSAEAAKKRKTGGNYKPHMNRAVSGIDIYLDSNLARDTGFKINKTPRKDGNPGCPKCGHNRFKTKGFDDYKHQRIIECRNPNCQRQIAVNI